MGVPKGETLKGGRSIEETLIESQSSACSEKEVDHVEICSNDEEYIGDISLPEESPRTSLLSRLPIPSDRMSEDVEVESTILEEDEGCNSSRTPTSPRFFRFQFWGPRDRPVGVQQGKKWKGGKSMEETSGLSFADIELEVASAESFGNDEEYIDDITLPEGVPPLPSCPSCSYGLLEVCH